MEFEIENILQVCLDNDINLSLSHNNDLVLRAPKVKAIDQRLIAVIKTHKAAIVEYLLKLNSTKSTRTVRRATTVYKHQDKEYYHVTPNEIYWLDEKIDEDFKVRDRVHGTAYLMFQLIGQFNYQTFVEAIELLVTRHESLRTTFHYIDNHFLMNIEKKPVILINVMETENSPDPEDKVVKDFLCFSDHSFDLSKEPAIAFRLVTSNSANLLSIKMHHVIVDSISQEVLLRDLFNFYERMVQNGKDTSTQLNFHLKDYLSSINEHRQMFLKRDQLYWTKRYPMLPPDLYLPISEETEDNSSEQILGTQAFSLPQDLLGSLNVLAETFSTSLFLIIQSMFKAFMYSETNQNDVTIGTYIFARDLDEAPEHIGCFAKTVLIRTILKKPNDLAAVINDVRESNDEMKQYNAYTLKEHFINMLDGQNLYRTFWKVNIQYYSVSSIQSGDPIAPKTSLELRPIGYLTNSHVQIHIHFQFLKLPSELTLLVNYDSSLYKASELKSFVEKFISYMKKAARNFGINSKEISSNENSYD